MGKVHRMWCESPADGDSHCWESYDEGSTWQDAGLQWDGTLGPPEIIDPDGPCPRCGSPITQHPDNYKETSD